MARLKFGDLVVDAKKFDLRVAYWEIMKGNTNLPGHEHPGIIDMWSDTRVFVMRYDCTQTQLEGTAHVDKKGRFLVSQKTVFSGVDASGASTKAAADKLFSAYVAQSGYGGNAKFDQKLNKRFGSYARAVPYAKFLKAFGSSVSFDIFANVRYMVRRIVPSVQMPTGSVFLAVPYDILFQAEPTFDCRTGQEIQSNSGFSEFAEHVALDPKDSDLRKILRKQLEQDRKALAENVEEAKNSVAREKARAEQEPDSKFYKALYKIEKKYAESVSKQLKNLNKRLKGYADD